MTIVRTHVVLVDGLGGEVQHLKGVEADVDFLASLVANGRTPGESSWLIELDKD